MRDAIFPLFSVFVWTGENDSNTVCVDAYFFCLKTEGKNLPFTKYLDTCGQDLIWAIVNLLSYKGKLQT